MSTRNAKLLWMKDVIDHLRDCHKQLQWSEDSETVHVLTETMLRDLESCRRLCEELNRRGRVPHAV